MLLYYEQRKNTESLNSLGETALSLMDIIELEYDRIEYFDLSSQFVERLQGSMYDVAGAVIVVSSDDELKEFSRQKALLEDLYLLLILFVDNPAMLASALELRPRYFACWAKDKKEILRTLHNFIRIIKKRKQTIGSRDKE